MKAWRFVFSLLTLLGPATGLAAIEGFQNTLVTIKPYYEISNVALDLRNYQNSTDVLWAPNSRGTEGVEIFFNNMIGLEIATLNNLSNQNTTANGSTSYSELRVGLVTPSIDLGLFQTSYQGLYVVNSASIAPGPSGSPSIQAAGFNDQTLQLDFLYTWSSEQFSQQAALNQTVRQDASGGSFLLAASLSQLSLNNNASLVPGVVASQFGVDQNVTTANFYTLELKVGYGYTVVLAKYWFATAEAMVGLGAQYASYSDSVSSRTYWDAQPEYGGMLAAGYNGDRFFASLRALYDTLSYRTDSLDFVSTSLAARLSLGVRF